MTTAKRRPAKRPPQRTVDVALTEGPFAGWQCTVRADFPARVLGDLQSGSIERILRALDVIVVAHNFPTIDDELAESMADVDPYDGLMTIAARALTAIGSLPNR